MAIDRREGARPPSMADVARHAGVALGTVSNTLNQPEKVREPTRRRVLAAIAELGFVRNDAARSLAVGTSSAIGLVLADMGNSFFVDIARGVESVMRARDMDVLIVNSDIDQQRERHNLELLERARVAGVVLAPLDTPQARAGALPLGTTPTVFANYDVTTETASAVTADERHGGALAAEHVIALGRTRLLFVGGPLFLGAVAQRRDGAAASVGVTLETLETDGLKIAHGRAAGQTVRERGRGRYDAIIAASDLLAIGLIQALRDAPGFSVPVDIAITGYDDNHFAAESDIPITTVRQRGEAMGRLAAERLLEVIADPAARSTTTVVRPELVARASTLGPDWHSD